MKKAASADTYYNLLHLVHPFPLECLINLTRHVAKLRLFLMMISAKSEKAQMSKDLLLDMVDSSGINLEAVVKSLMEARADVKSHSGTQHNFFFDNEVSRVAYIRIQTVLPILHDVV